MLIIISTYIIILIIYTFYLFIILVAHFNLKIKQFNVKNIFLNTFYNKSIKLVIYKFPNGFK